jgi:hypothetical protein
MVTTTTKTLNYSITKGSSTNSVNATITSTPGFNSNYLGKVPGILKILELILACVALGLIAAQREEDRALETVFQGPVYNADGSRIEWPQFYQNTNNVYPRPSTVNNANVNREYVAPPHSYNRERFLVGEVYFLCAHSAVITMLVVILIAYLFHTTSAMIVPKATTVENVMNLILGLLLLAAGITEIVMTELWKNDSDIQSPYYRPVMTNTARGTRLAAGAIAIINGIMFIVSFVMSRKELAGPKTL